MFRPTAQVGLIEHAALDFQDPEYIFPLLFRHLTAEAVPP